jgi:hypothetical protein
VLDIEGTALVSVAPRLIATRTDFDWMLFSICPKKILGISSIEGHSDTSYTGTCVIIVAHSATDPASARQALWRGGVPTEIDALAVLLRYRHLILLPPIRWRKVEIRSWSDPLVDDSAQITTDLASASQEALGGNQLYCTIPLIATLNTSPTEFVRIVPALSISSSLPNRHFQY